MSDPTPRRLDILAAWHKGGCSNVAAGELLNLSPQIIRNELHHLRREAGAKDNTALVQRYRHDIMDRELRPTTRRNGGMKRAT
jgi:DNA-binding NarL/FixJ family response regulator